MKLIVTSRAALRLRRWEYEFQLTPLALADPCLAQICETLERVPRVALFVERGRARRPGFSITDQNSGAIAQICVRLDGLPLALELAAVRVKFLSPEDVLARLQSQPTS